MAPEPLGAPHLRAELLGRARRVVVKIGSRLLHESPVGRPATLADELAALRSARPLEVVIVSSGAIALGVRVLGLPERPHELPRLQAAAAIGQGLLMKHWEHAFAVHGVPVGQVLLTHEDVADRGRFLAARHAFLALLEYGAIPIVNENDTVAVEEIRFGDNDRLAALVCNLIAADALIILTDVDGLHDAPPAQGGHRIPLVRDIDREAMPVAGGSTGGLGTGGMSSKVTAARIATLSGVPTVVAPGRRPGVLRAVLGAEDVGTLFAPADTKLASRKQWIAFVPRPSGSVRIDAGACQALIDKGRSLLASGISEVSGRFAAGEIVSILDPEGRERARGLAGYSSDELERIRGHRSADIEAILGYKYLDEAIHRDDLVLL